MVLTLLQLPAVQHNASCDGCVRDAEENKMWKESLVENNVAKEKLNVIYNFNNVKK